METTAGTGASTQTAVESAVEEAMARAQQVLAGRTPVFGFLFAAKRHNLTRALASAQALAKGAEIVGCTTGGEMTERGLTRGGIAVMLVASEAMVTDLGIVRGLTSTASPARVLTANFSTAQGEARQRGLAASTTFLLCDGLTGAFEPMVGEVRKYTHLHQQVVGGGAADDWELKSTLVGARGVASSDAAVALHVFGKKAVGMGVEHGLKPNTLRMTATRTTGNVIHEIDGKSAYDVYREYALRQGVALDDQNRGAFFLQHPIGVYFFENLMKARAPAAVTADGSIVCYGSVPQLSSMCIVSSKPDQMIGAARRAAMDAASALKGTKAAGVLVIDCVCREAVLKGEFHREIEAIREVFPNVPLAGFLSYGEAARFKGKLDGYHNNTIVVAAIPA
jgi:hypothetical protein